MIPTGYKNGKYFKEYPWNGPDPHADSGAGRYPRGEVMKDPAKYATHRWVGPDTKGLKAVDLVSGMDLVSTTIRAGEMGIPINKGWIRCLPMESEYIMCSAICPEFVEEAK